MNMVVDVETDGIKLGLGAIIVEAERVGGDVVRSSMEPNVPKSKTPSEWC